MLYLNHEPVQFTAQMRKEVEEFTGGKYPVIIKWPKDIYSTPKSSKNKRRDRPPITIIPYKAVVHGENGTELWIYSDTPAKKNKEGQNLYSPIHMELDEMAAIGKEKMELLYFLIFKSTVRLNSKNLQPGVRPMFRIENREKERAAAAELKKIRAKAEYILYERITGDDLVTVAMAMNVSNATLMGPNELKETISRRLEIKGTKEGYEEFLEMLKLEDEKDEKNSPLNRNTQNKAILQKAKDAKLIEADKGGKAWWFLDAEGKRTSKVCDTLAGMSIDQSLIYAIGKNAELMETIRQSVEEKEVGSK